MLTYVQQASDVDGISGWSFLFLGVKQMQMSKFNTLLLQRLDNFISSLDKLIVSADM